jgi:hypothetical protein
MSAWLTVTTDVCLFFLFVSAALCLYRMVV